MHAAALRALIPGVGHPVTRRRALGILLATPLIVSYPPDASLAGGKAGGAASITGETYVGRTADPAVFIAVVLGAQHVTAYLCDGLPQQIDRWFYGHLIDETVVLVATDGARLIGLRSRLGMSGWVRLPDGSRTRFVAHPATGAAGLYDIRVLADGSLYGTSGSGAILDGEPLPARSSWDLLPFAASPAAWQILGLASHQAFADGVTFAAQITLPDAQIVPVGGWMPSSDPGHRWVILLADGAARGHGIALASGAWMDAHAGLTR